MIRLLLCLEIAHVDCVKPVVRLALSVGEAVWRTAAGGWCEPEGGTLGVPGCKANWIESTREEKGSEVADVSPPNVRLFRFLPSSKVPSGGNPESNAPEAVPVSSRKKRFHGLQFDLFHSQLGNCQYGRWRK